MIYNTETSINEKSEFTLDYDGGLALLAESEANWNKMMRSVGITEEILSECGVEVLNEGAKEFFANIKKWFMDILNKIKTFFKELIAKLRGKNKQLQEKAEKIGKAPKKKVPETFEGFVFTNLDRGCPDYDPFRFEYHPTGNGGTAWSTWSDEEIEERLKSYEEKLTNNKYTDDGLDERLKKFFRNGKEDKSDVLSYYKSLNISNELNKLNKCLDDASEEIARAENIIQHNIKEVERMEKQTDEFARNNFGIDTDAGKEDHANIMHSVGNWGKITKGHDNMYLKYESARLAAINEAMDQLNRYMSSPAASTNESYLSKFLDKVIL